MQRMLPPQTFPESWLPCKKVQRKRNRSSSCRCIQRVNRSAAAGQLARKRGWQ
ncbi:MAG: hypothetical protein ACLR5S_10545 [Ruminococcus sp.]